VTGHDQASPPAGIDTSTPNPARIYDALLGGKDNFPADRDAAHAILNVAPQARRGARENRAFLQRAVRYLAADAGIRLFLDIGTGLPTQGNVHQIAQAVSPDVRVAYVDNDPVVHVHANALLADNTTTVAVLADLREPEVILGHPQVRRLLDLAQPVAVLLVAVLHFLRDEEDPAGIVARLRDAMAPGSFLVLSHATADFHPEAAAKVAAVYEQASAPLVPRSGSQVERFFGGFELLEPGLVQPPAWRPEGGSPSSPSAGGFYSGVGRRRAGRRSIEDHWDSRTMTTGQCACSETRRLTEPSREPATPPWPWEPTTSRSTAADASIRAAAALPWTARLSMLAGRSSVGRPVTASERISLAWRSNGSSEAEGGGITPILASQAWMTSRPLPRARASSAAHRRALAEDSGPSTPTTIRPPSPLCEAVMMISRG